MLQQCTQTLGTKMSDTNSARQQKSHCHVLAYVHDLYHHMDMNIYFLIMCMCCVYCVLYILDVHDFVTKCS